MILLKFLYSRFVYYFFIIGRWKNRLFNCLFIHITGAFFFPLNVLIFLPFFDDSALPLKHMLLFLFWSYPFICFFLFSGGQQNVKGKKKVPCSSSRLHNVRHYPVTKTKDRVATTWHNFAIVPWTPTRKAVESKWCGLVPFFSYI